jgi:hypothetical protein
MLQPQSVGIRTISTGRPASAPASSDRVPEPRTSQPSAEGPGCLNVPSTRSRPKERALHEGRVRHTGLPAYGRK